MSTGPVLSIDSATLLRLPAPADVQALHALIRENLDHLAAWRTWTADMLTLDRVSQYVVRNQRAYNEVLSPDFTAGGHPGFSFLIVHQGKPAGMAGFQGLNRTNDIAALGYWLGAGFTGKGLMTASCRLICAYAFDVLDMNRLEIQTLTENRASAGVAERLGFVKEARLEQVERLAGGGYADHFLYRLLRTERS